MTERESQADRAELEAILRRIDSARLELVQAMESTNLEDFDRVSADEDTVRAVAQRVADEVNFNYGQLTARALNLPQPPYLTRADFGSLREAVASIQIAHRRFTNLLHDLVPDDLDKSAEDPDLGSYSLRQVLELAAAQYALRAQQIRQFGARETNLTRE